MDSNIGYENTNIENCESVAALRAGGLFCSQNGRCPVKPVTLLRAAAAIFPAPAPTTTRTAWAVAADAGLRPVRPRGPFRNEVAPREIAALLVARLAGDDKPSIAALTGELGRMRSVSPVMGVPPEWIATRRLPAGHRMLDLIEALVIDALAGRMDAMRDMLGSVLLSFHGAPLGAQFRLSSDGVDALANGNPSGSPLTLLSSMRATYRAAVGNAASGSQKGFGGASGIAASRTMTVGAILELVESTRH